MKDNDNILSHKPVNKSSKGSKLYKHGSKTYLHNSSDGDLFSFQGLMPKLSGLEPIKNKNKKKKK